MLDREFSNYTSAVLIGSTSTSAISYVLRIVVSIGAVIALCVELGKCLFVCGDCIAEAILMYSDGLQRGVYYLKRTTNLCQ